MVTQRVLACNEARRSSHGYNCCSKRSCCRANFKRDAGAHVQVLNAWGNELTRLPDGFGGLTSLVRLGLKGNQLSDLPDSFCQLHSLVELFLTDNKLTTLPAGTTNSLGTGRTRRLRVELWHGSTRC